MVTKQRNLIPEFNPIVGEQMQTTATIRNIRFTSSDGTFCIMDATTRKRNNFTMVGPLAAFKVGNAVVMEQVAKMAFIAYGVNPNLTMNDLLIEKHFNRKHGPNAYYGQKKK